MNYNREILEIITNFLNSINIIVIEKKLIYQTFLPGLQINGNTICFDREKLMYPGDILHEAGHIAVAEENIRPIIGTSKIEDTWPTDGEEIAAILWSYAASYHLKLDLNIVFHTNGYKNDSKWLIKQFDNKNYIGLNLLEWMNLCKKEDFPIMRKWLR